MDHLLLNIEIVILITTKCGFVNLMNCGEREVELQCKCDQWSIFIYPKGLKIALQVIEQIIIVFNHILLIMLLDLSQFFPLCLPPPSTLHSLKQSPHHCSGPWSCI